MKKLKHLFTILLTIFCITNVSYAVSLDYGLYNVKNDVYHEQEIGMNMARTYLNETMRVEAKTNGAYYYTVEFSGTEYMNKHRILVNGSQVSVTKKSNSSKGTIKLTFKVKSLSSKIKAKLYVDAMGRDVEFQIIPKFDTAQCVKKYSTKTETTKKNNTDKTNSKSETKTEDKNKTSKSESKTDETKEEKAESKEKEEKENKTDETKKEADKKEQVNEENNSTNSKQDEVKEEEKIETEKVEAVKDEKKSSKMPLIIGGVAVLAVVGIVAVFIKKRK